MKLRNKKTGEIGDLMGSERSCPYIGIGLDFHDGNPKAFYYTSLDELNDEWEDYEPAEPHQKGRMNRFELLAMAEMVFKGYFGNGEERRQRLGEHYDSIQRIVDTVIDEEEE